MKPLNVVWAGTVGYETASQWQRELHERRVANEIPDVLLLLEHPHVFTLGRRFEPEHLLWTHEQLEAKGVELFEADRGGSITYHGPGQLVGYPILDLSRPGGQPDAIRYLRTLEEALIRTVREYGILARRREGMTGVWVGESKLGSIGVNVSRAVSKHGFALNVSPELSFFHGMVACGISDARATSMEQILGVAPDVGEVAGKVIDHVAQLLYMTPVPKEISSLRLMGEVLPLGKRLDRAAGSQGNAG